MTQNLITLPRASFSCLVPSILMSHVPKFARIGGEPKRANQFTYLRQFTDDLKREFDIEWWIHWPFVVIRWPAGLRAVVFQQN